MGKRHDKLGMKQTIQKKWMDYTVEMMVEGLSEHEIRAELKHYLATQKQSGGRGERSKKTCDMAISILASWFSPAKELIVFRDHALDLARKVAPEMWLPYHWAIISASYPFWFTVAKQTGRLLNLQDQVTQLQIVSRLKEHYGDRETVARNAQYVIRSFVAWGVLNDSKGKGCYEQNGTMKISNADVAILLFEAALHADSRGTLAWGIVKTNPAFFLFHLPIMTGDYIAQKSAVIDVVRYGLDDELLQLKNV